MNFNERYISTTIPIEINKKRDKTTIEISNTGDRAIQIGSHFHLFEANKFLKFDRNAAFGMHLDIPAGTAVRIEPGDTKTVQLCSYGGMKRIIGFNGLTDSGIVSPDRRVTAIRRADREGFLSTSPQR